jgi:hypothetical protein
MGEEEQNKYFLTNRGLQVVTNTTRAGEEGGSIQEQLCAVQGLKI